MHFHKLLKSLAVAVFLLGAPTFVWADKSVYTLTDLGTLGGGASQAYALNDMGQVVGWSAAVGYSPAFLWQDGVMLDLGILGGVYSCAYGINNRGQVVGIADTGIPPGSHSEYHACLWDNGNAIDLGTLGGGWSGALGINDLGQIVGGSSSSEGSWGQACLWQDGGIMNLGTPLGTEFGSIALAINNKGQVVGHAIGFSSGPWASPVIWSNGQWTRLTSNQGDEQEGIATAINNLGEVVGWHRFDSDEGGEIRFDPFIWRNGVTVTLPTLAGEWHEALGINDVGQVVGLSSPPDGPQRACLWSNGTIQDLNSLIPNNSGWTLYDAYDINNKGQIVGNGVAPDGERRAFLLTPAQVNLAGHLYLKSASISNEGEFGLADSRIDPLHWVDPPGTLDRLSTTFGNNLETQDGWRRVVGGENLAGNLLKGQWSRQGRPVYPWRLKLLGEIVDSHPWHQRSLVTSSEGTVWLQGLTDSDFVPLRVRLDYDTQIDGWAVEDGAMIMFNWAVDSARLVLGVLGGVGEEFAKQAAEKIIKDQILNALDTGIVWLPEQSRFQAETEITLSLKQDGLGFGLPPSPEIYSGVEYSLSAGTIFEQTRQWPRCLIHRQGEWIVEVNPDLPIMFDLSIGTLARTLGGAEAFAGVYRYRIQFDVPETGSDPLIIERIDPLPQDWDITGAFYKNLLLATVSTPELITGPVTIAAGLGSITPSVGDELVVLGNTEPAGFLMPLHIGENDTDLALRIAALVADPALADMIGLQMIFFKDEQPYIVSDCALNDLFTFSEGLGTAEMPYGALLSDLDFSIIDLPRGEGVLLVAFGNLDDLAPQASLGIDLLAPTPEPTTLAMLTLGVLLVAGRRFRRLHTQR